MTDCQRSRRPITVPGMNYFPLNRSDNIDPSAMLGEVTGFIHAG